MHNFFCADGASRIVKCNVNMHVNHSSTRGTAIVVFLVRFLIGQTVLSLTVFG